MVVQKKVKKLTTAQLNKKVWEECKRIIRLRYPNTCYTCGRSGLEGSNLHTGHMISKASLPLKYKYDLAILRPQCYNCNINHGGQGAYFIKRWEAEGNSFEDLEREINLAKQKPMGGVESWIFLTNLLEEYKSIK